MIDNAWRRTNTPPLKQSPIEKFKKRSNPHGDLGRAVRILAQGSGNMPPWVGINFEAYWKPQRGRFCDERMAYLVEVELPRRISLDEQRQLARWLAECWLDRQSYQYVIVVEEGPTGQAQTYASFLVEYRRSQGSRIRPSDPLRRGT
jgi:hypothetical protein